MRTGSCLQRPEGRSMVEVSSQGGCWGRPSMEPGLFPGLLPLCDPP